MAGRVPATLFRRPSRRAYEHGGGGEVVFVEAHIVDQRATLAGHEPRHAAPEHRVVEGEAPRPHGPRRRRNNGLQDRGFGVNAPYLASSRNPMDAVIPETAPVSTVPQAMSISAIRVVKPFITARLVRS